MARRLVRAIAFGLLRVARFAERTSRSLVVATFTRPELDRLSVSEWEAFGEQGAVVGDGPFSWETEFFAKHIRPGDAILVVGAGTGRDVLPFLAEGHEVTALDITPRALEVLRERAASRGFKVKTIHSSIVLAGLPREAFDVVLFSWFSFGYLRGAGERREALARGAASLKAGGRILLSYSSEAGSAAPAPSWAARMVSRLLGGGGGDTEPGDQFNVSGTASRPGMFFSHSFTTTAIENEVRGLGFEIVSHHSPTNGIGVMALMRRTEAG